MLNNYQSNAVDIINNSEFSSAIYRNLETHIPQKLDVQKMKQAVKYFEGEHDFKAFKASGTSSKSSVRTIYKAEVIEDGERINIELTGNGETKPFECVGTVSEVRAALALCLRNRKEDYENDYLKSKL